MRLLSRPLERAIPLLFGITTFASAFLIFLIQPLIARAVLPWFGGTAAVWATCLMFFQMALVLGYAYAHLSVGLLSPRNQATVHIAMLALTVLALPVTPGAQWKPSGAHPPAWDIMMILAATVGAPYILLASTSPMLQAWFARIRPGLSPYALFALSNAGSLLGLLSYPLFIEPATRLRTQGVAWSAAYAVFVLACAGLAIIVKRRAAVGGPADRISVAGPSPRWTRKFLWVLLAFCPSVLLLATTTHITQDIAPIPLLWVLPLALYLMTFVIAFGNSNWYGRYPWFTIFVGAAASLAFTTAPGHVVGGALTLVLGVSGAFFCCAFVCHGELYRLRPEPSHLTSFYLMISIGGALGGIFVSLLAPALFNGYLELPLSLLASVAAILIVLPFAKPSIPGRFGRRLEYVLLALLACGISFILFRATFQPGVKMARRNFYGALRVAEEPIGPLMGAAPGTTAGDAVVRELFHGTTMHGFQFVGPEKSMLPTSYFAPTSGIGKAIDSRPHPLRIGVIGLGAGTIAAYARLGDVYDFYEINPLVVEIARSKFGFVSNARGRVNVIMGDARLSLERESPRAYDVLAVDAFSGDSIPVHLMTVEAFREYFRHVVHGGIVAAHVSNRYLNLVDVVSSIGGVLDKPALLVGTRADVVTGTFESLWVLLANDPAVFGRPEWAGIGTMLAPRASLKAWTDDYVNIVASLAYQ